MSLANWYAKHTRSVWNRPTEGDLVAVWRGVWLVEGVEDLEPSRWNEADDEAAASGRGLRGGPYRVRLQHRGGLNPLPINRGEQKTGCAVDVHVNTHDRWQTYIDGRWPQCSCCGEPMPCTAADTDRAVKETMATLDVHAAKLDGCCWACGEPITARQKTVAFAGINLDLPGGPAVRFHLRHACRPTAERYEERWRAEDESRSRILTWPPCPGRLIVHGDGTSECHGGLDVCNGASTHDHRSISACFIQTHGCPRECSPVGHPGCRYSDRPIRQIRAAS